MMNIVALSKEKGSSYTEHSSVVTLDSASILKIAISREDIKSFSRVNNDLIVELNDHEKITIKNFFTVGANGQHSDLVLEDPHDGTLWWLENPGTDAAAYTSIDSLAEVGTQTTANEHIGAWTIAGAALLGIGAMLLGASKSDHRHSDNDDSDSESGSKTTTTTGNTVVNGETGDTTAPTEPSGIQLSDDGKTISGKGEVGSTVTVKDAEGNTLGSATVGSDGTFSVTLPTAQTNGQTLSVTSTDAAGNTSSAATISAPDTTVPAEPSGVQLSDDGKTISGKGEVGSTVTVTDASGKALGTGTVGADGTFSVTLTTPQTNGQTLSVVSTDTAGNASDPASVTAKDTTALATPTDVVVSDDGVTVTGKAEAGSTVAIKDAAGTTLGSATTAADGTFSVTLSTAQTNGQVLSVAASDKAGNTSIATSVTAKDTTAPAAPTDVLLSDDGVTVTGKGEIGSIITVTNINGKALGTGKVDSDGTFSVTLDAAQTNGQTLSVAASDTTGNTSETVSVTAKDTTAPNEPTDLVIDDSSLMLSGKGEEGTTVKVYDSNGNVVASGTVNDDGTFEVKLPEGLSINQDLSVTLTDSSNNESDKGIVTYSDNSGSGTDDQLIANADTHTATVTAVQDNLTGTSGNIVQAVGLTALSVVDISLFSSNTFDFTVSNNTSEDVTLDVSGSVALSAVAGLTSLLSLLGLNNFSADLSVINTSTGEVVQTLSNAISINAGLVNLTYSGSVYIQGLTSGTYTVAVSSANSSSVVGRLLSLLVSANVGTVLSVDITDSVQYVFGETSGNVLSSDTAGDVADTGTSIHVTSVVATSVDGSSAVTVASSGTTTITGEYGVLTIAADGSYSYQPTSGNSDIGKSDVFTYTITNASGQTATATLTLTIEGTHSTAVADVVSLSDTTVLAAGSSLTYTTDTLVNGVTVAKNAVVTNSVSQSITVASGTTLDDASLVLKFTAANSILNLSTTVVSGTLTILNVTTGESESLTLSNASLLLGTSTSQTISLSDMGLAELTEGNYTITLAYSATNKSALLGGAALTITSSLSGTSVDTTHHYTVSETTSGNILDGTDSDSVADTFGIQYQSFTMTGNNASGTSVSYTVSGGDKSITDSSGSTVSGDTATLYGKYGTLVISNEGSYTYTLKAGIDTSTITTKETFSYSLNDSDGTSSTAKLTIDLHPVITGSANADTIASTAYDDTFTTGSGADTVVYKLLADDNTGGNGNDTWTDFSAAQGDHIDVSALLVGWDGKSSSLGNYISVSHTDNNTVVSIDRDGTGSHYSSATLVTLENANVTLDELIDHNSSS
ncbi:type I secretion C-terminal target domain (VC_A0849 subclass) [Rosenbergiella nectarea]|uniref:Type I secretion C-terminal target domain (VC_A0849 subclass) n=1 Tax=Rosenbergiella nectarea TaxID=988801 RepID=A0A1H9F5A4_9GAMM|nr:Ig-like domain-containing protein [Rosenbergiella nectarea]SEQ32438.1 type I secretion C-terminal target domain (VC_A0849 subclass) [Rosenbergiella nectarea]